MSRTTTPTPLSAGPPQAARDDLPLWRLQLLRVGYGIVAAGLVAVVWPGFLAPDPGRDLMSGVVDCMLVAFSLLALLGLRHPVRMVPVLLWESAWKLLWLGTVALPAWRGGGVDAATAQVLASCVWVVLVLAVVPWGHVARRYAGAPAERWR